MEMKARWMPLSVAVASFALFGFEGGCGEPEPPACPEIACLLDCPFGERLDLNGCGTCDCLPPPPLPCDQLDEAGCQGRTDCVADYAELACDCAPCAPGFVCPPCDCPAAEEVFLGCRERDPCEDLDEAACVAAPECGPSYGWPACPLCAPDAFACPPCDPAPIYEGCQQLGPCEGLGEAACAAAADCEPHYEWAVCDAACIPEEGGGCAPCDPAPLYTECLLREDEPPTTVPQGM